ncbi:lytic transglycosylase domain-containing protein [Glaciimonas sp. GG7]
MASQVTAAEEVEALLTRCAPAVHPETMRAVLSAESGGNVLAIADAGPLKLPWKQRKHLVRSIYPADKIEAVAVVKKLLENGHTVSIGLAQINDRNLPRLGVSIEDMFEPCKNVKAGALVLTEFYQSALSRFDTSQQALRAALSSYNSGDFFRGENDGYVDRVTDQVGKPLVLVEGGSTETKASSVIVPALNRKVKSTARPDRLRAPDRLARKPVLPAESQKYAKEDFTMIVTSFESK